MATPSISTSKKTVVSSRYQQQHKQQQQQKQQQHKQYRSLVSYLKYFEGSEVTVELKNGRQWTGILMSAEEPSMNLLLARSPVGAASTRNTSHDTTIIPTTATTTTTTLPQHQQIHIRGAAIRYINFTDDVMDTIRTGQDRERSAHQKYTRGVRKS